jgi:hypothetical protein
MKRVFSLLFLFFVSFNNLLQAQCSTVTVEAYQVSVGNYKIRATLAYPYNQSVYVGGTITPEPGAPTDSYDLEIPAGSLTGETQTTWQLTDPYATPQFSVGVSPCPPPDITASYAGVTITYEVGNHILRFNSADDVITVLDQLDADYETYNTNYINQYPNLTNDQLDDMDDQNAFDEFASFKNFEGLFSGFVSKRSQIETIENTWLSNDFSGTDPDDVDFTFDDAENTIFNDSYQFKISDDTYEMRTDGLYNLSNGALTIFRQYSNSLMTYLPKYAIPGTGLFPTAYLSPDGSDYSTNSAVDVTLMDEILNDDNFDITNDICVTNVRHKGTYPYGNDRRFELKVAVHHFLVRSSAKGKVVSFKKKSGHWKRRRSTMAVGLVGNIYITTETVPCNALMVLNRRNPSSGYNDRKKSLKTVQHGAGPAYKTKTNELYAFFELPDGTHQQLYVY